MVIGGYNEPDGALSSVEVIDLENPANNCDRIRDYPIKDNLMTVGFINGLVKSCGSAYDTNECYDYDPATNLWVQSDSMLYPRDSPRSSFIDSVWLVSGDGTGDEDSPLATEIWNYDHFEEGPTLPIETFYLCQLTVNSTHVFFADPETGGTFLLDWFSQTWTELAPMTPNKIYPHCGLINNDENGKEVVIAENGVTEIFNLNDMAWRTGPSLPAFNRAVTAQLPETFLVVGGYSDSADEYLDTIYEFDQNNYEWVLMSQRLQEPKDYPGVVLVPDDFVTCGQV